MVKQGAISDGWVAKESNERLTVWLQRVGGRWVVESLGILRCAQDDSDNKQQGGSGNLRRRKLTYDGGNDGIPANRKKVYGNFPKEKKRGSPSLLLFGTGQIGTALLEADAECNWNKAGLVAVLGKDVEAIPIAISIRKGAGGVEGINIASFDEEPLSGKARELIGEADAAIQPEGVAGVFVDGLISLVGEASIERIAILPYRWNREVGGLVVETATARDVSAEGIGGIEVDDRAGGKGPDVAGAAELSETTTATAGTVVDCQQVVERCGLETEVVPVKLNDGAEGLVKVASCACLDVVTGGEIAMTVADGQGEAATYKEGVFGGAVGVGAAVVIVGTAVATARRRLVGAAEAEGLGVRHLVAAGAARVFEVIRGREIERCSEA
jgi:hypothetical protein